MEQALWQTEPGAILACELGGFRLAVERANGWVRYTVHRRPDGSGDSSPMLVASGNKDDVHAAMRAAEGVAAGHAGARRARGAGASHHGPARDHAA